MRIRKRRAPRQDADHFSLQLLGSSAEILRRQDDIDTLEMCSERIKDGTRSEGQAAAFPIALLVAGANPHAAQAALGRPRSTRAEKAQVELDRSTRVADSEAHQNVTGYENTHHNLREAKHVSEEGFAQVVSSEHVVLSARDDENMTTPLLQEKNLGTRCTRADGRSWQCRRTSLPGFALCEHHHLQLSNQSRRQRSFQRAFNQSSRKRLRKRDSRTDAKLNAVEGKTATDSGRWKARSVNAIVRRTEEHVESSDSSS